MKGNERRVQFKNEGFTRLLRQRLMAREKASQTLEQTHPQAEMLTAFAERLLPETENSSILLHLAGCADCRDVVFVATAPEALTAANVFIPTRAGWMSWPNLRWAALSASVIIVAAIVTVHYGGGMVHQQTGRSHVSLRQQANAPVIVARNIAPPAPEPKSYAPSKAQSLVLDVPTQPVKQANNLRSTMEPARRAISAAPKFSMQFDGPEQVVGADATRNSTASLGARLAKSGNQLKSSNALVAQEQDDELEYLNPDDKAVPPRSTMDATVAQSAPMAAAAQTQLTPSLTASAYSPKWMLTSGGALQRSLDKGRTWERISVADNVPFRALSVLGAEIWVGGPAGALYHTVDSGLHWAQVVPQANGELLSSEITAIEFSNSSNGTLNTTAGEIWTTSDAGNSWQKK